MINVPSLEAMLDKLEWNWVGDFRNAPRFPWYEDGVYVGMEKTWGNLTFVSMNNAGHFVQKDQILYS